jgi:putative endopeptidase
MEKHMKHLMLGAAAIGLLTACGQGKASTDTAELTVAEAPVINADGKYVTAEGLELSTPDTWGQWGINLDNVKTDMNPGDDFYAYVNGKWLDTFEIPSDRTRYGSFTLLAEKSEQRVRKIIDELAAAKPDPATLEGKVAGIYNAYLDTAAIEAKGLSPVQSYLDRIQAMETREDLAEVFAANGFTAPVGGWVDVDSKQTDQYIFYFTQADLGMGDRDYYLVDKDENTELRAAYKAMLSSLLGAAGYDDADAAADKVIALETEIAKAHWDRAAGRNRNLTYNKVTKAELIALGGAFPTATLIDALDLGDQAAFVVRQVTPTAEEIAENGLDADQLAKVSGGGVPGLFKVMQTAPMDQWKAYLTAHLLIDTSDVLPASIDDTVFDFYGKTLNGLEEQRERWKRGVDTVENSVGEAVGKVYAARYFPAENKAAMDQLVANLRVALSGNLESLDWMGAAKPRLS